MSLETRTTTVPHDVVTIATSNEGTVTSTRQPWVFEHTPNDYTGHLDRHVSGTRFSMAVIQEVVPYTLEDAGAILAHMGQDPTVQTCTYHLTEDVMTIAHKTVELKFNPKLFVRDIHSTGESGRLGFLQPFRTRSIWPTDAKYAMLTGVIIRYRPLCPPFSDEGKITVSLMDSGIAHGKAQSRASFTRSVDCNVLLGLNYCMEVASLPRLSIMFSASNTGMMPLISWGTVEMAFHFTFGKKPLQRGVTRATVQYIFASDIFEVVGEDPNVCEAELEQSDYQKLRRMVNDIHRRPPVAGFTKGRLGTKQPDGTYRVLSVPPADQSPPIENPFSPTQSLRTLAASPSSLTALGIDRPTTVALENARASVNILERALEERRSQESAALAARAILVTNMASSSSRSNSVDNPSSASSRHAGTLSDPVVSGLPAILSRLLGTQVSDDVDAFSKLSADKLTELAGRSYEDVVVFTGVSIEGQPIRIASRSFHGSAPIKLGNLLGLLPRAQFSVI